MRRYQVKSLFGPTLQGEGLHAGMPCLFLRLAGCNAWDGRPEKRATSACPYCDTDFLGGEPLDAAAISERLAALVPESGPGPGRSGRGSTGTLGLVLTGGEPLLQADGELLATLGAAFRWVDIETNGTRPCPVRPANVFISCSPKRIAGQEVVVEADWWKVLIPDQESFLERALASGKPVYVDSQVSQNASNHTLYSGGCIVCLNLKEARCIDPEFAPGVGTPVRGGATYREAHLAMEMICDCDRLLSMELVEVNPVLDTANRTAELGVQLVASAMGKKIL